MRFLSNTYDPDKPDADMMVLVGFHETRQDAVRHHREWLRGKIIGDPQATPTYTVEQLKAMNMVGVYAP